MSWRLSSSVRRTARCYGKRLFAVAGVFEALRRGGLFFFLFLGYGFPFKLNQAKRGTFFPHDFLGLDYLAANNKFGQDSVPTQMCFSQDFQGNPRCIGTWAT